jgi:hypothetical protein
MMVAVGLATILLAGCASQPTDLVNSEGIAVSESRWDKEMNRLRLLFTSTGHPNHYRQQRSTYYPQSWQSTRVYQPPRQSQSNGRYGSRGSVDAVHHAQGHTHHHGH